MGLFEQMEEIALGLLQQKNELDALSLHQKNAYKQVHLFELREGLDLASHE
jgi:hypothetical protein